MKRFLLFHGDVYYPAGGWDDLRGDYDTVDAAKAVLVDPRKEYTWWHIVDTTTGEKVEEHQAMANNRLWLVHRPTGEATLLGKRMAVGWYPQPGLNLTENMKAFFDRCEAHKDFNFGNQDDFVLVMEDDRGAPSCTSDFVYDADHKPKLNG